MFVNNPNDADRSSLSRATKPIDLGCRTDMTLTRNPPLLRKDKNHFMAF
jgi:hypothetical protein